MFPCVPLGKEPATTNGFKDATRDPEIIRAWWTTNPNYNIGVSPDHTGMYVLDVDPPRGAETLASLELEHGLLPRTLSFKTPRGGLHHWFKGKCSSSVGTDKRGLGSKLDTRGYGGYVLLPPSRTTDGTYEQLNETEIANGPAWIAAELGRKREEHAAASDVDLDLPANIARAESLLHQYVTNGDVARKGAGADDRTYQLACEVLNLGLSPARGYDCIWRIWAPHCHPGSADQPEYVSAFIARKIKHASRYSQNEAGAWAVAPGAEIFADFAASVAEQSESISRSRYYPFELSDTDSFQPPEWLIPNLIPKRGTVQITGEQKSFKTFLALDMVLSLAAKGEPIVYIAGENASALVLKHVPAWCLGNNNVAELLPFRVVREMPHAAQPDEMIEFVREIKHVDLKPSVVVIDTATRALRGLDENSAKDMGQFSAACEMIQRELDCTVIVIRHTGKDASRGSRGSNVIEGDFDTILAVERQKDEQDRKLMFCTLTVREQRNAAELEKPFAYEMTPIGPSLVPREISTAEHASMTRREDPFSRQRAGSALVRLSATGGERAVSTYVLAMELTPPIPGESPEQHDAAIKRVERTLKIRARTSLAGYVSGEGSAMRWFVETSADINFDGTGEAVDRG